MNKHEIKDILFKALMDNIPDAIYLKDLKSRFLIVNKSCAEKHGFNSPEEAIGKTDFDSFSEEHARQAFEDEQNIIKTGKPIINLEEKETLDWYRKTDGFPQQRFLFLIKKDQ